MVDSFFGVIDSISSSLDGQLLSLSGSLAGSSLIGSVILLLLAAEIMICFILAFTGTGQQAVSRGVEAIVYTAFIYALTMGGAWGNIVIPMSRSIPNEVIGALGKGTDTSALRGDIANQFSRIIQGIMNPANIQPSARLNIPASGVPAAP